MTSRAYLNDPDRYGEMPTGRQAGMSACPLSSKGFRRYVPELTIVYVQISVYVPSVLYM